MGPLLREMIEYFLKRFLAGAHLATVDQLCLAQRLLAGTPRAPQCGT
jgi:hypothetical protein